MVKHNQLEKEFLPQQMIVNPEIVINLKEASVMLIFSCFPCVVKILIQIKFCSMAITSSFSDQLSWKDAAQFFTEMLPVCKQKAASNTLKKWKARL